MAVSELLDYVPDRAVVRGAVAGVDVPAFAIRSPVATGKLRSRARAWRSTRPGSSRRTPTCRSRSRIPGPYMLTRSAWYEASRAEGLSDTGGSRGRTSSRSSGTRSWRSRISVSIHPARRADPDAGGLRRGVQRDVHVRRARSRRDPTEEMDFRAPTRSTRRSRYRRRPDRRARLPWQLEPPRGCPAGRQLRAVAAASDGYAPGSARARDGDSTGGESDVFKEYGGEKEIGLGVVNPRTDSIESVDEIVGRTKEFLRYFSGREDLFEPRLRVWHFAERNVNTPDIAFRKLQAIAEAARLLRRDYS